MFPVFLERSCARLHPAALKSLPLNLLEGRLWALAALIAQKALQIYMNHANYITWEERLTKLPAYRSTTPPNHTKTFSDKLCCFFACGPIVEVKIATGHARLHNLLLSHLSGFAGVKAVAGWVFKIEIKASIERYTIKEDRWTSCLAQAGFTFFG